MRNEVEKSMGRYTRKAGSAELGGIKNEFSHRNSCYRLTNKQNVFCLDVIRRTNKKFFTAQL